MVDLFIVAGEASGDQLGEDLLQALKPSQLKIMGIGGPKMRAAGMETIFPMENLQVMGFIDVLFALPHLIRYFNKTVDAILKTRPKAVVTIDYPGFNLRLARTLRKKGFKGKICHYVCPSVWAWGKKRIGLMAKNLDLLLSILPFEQPLFAKTNLTVEYVGHPLVQKISVQENPDLQLIAFFPGSRTKEIEEFPLFYPPDQVAKTQLSLSICCLCLSRKIPTPLKKNGARSHSCNPCRNEKPEALPRRRKVRHHYA